jgi:predicted Fe-Mo cluster-binding NifX family protein
MSIAICAIEPSVESAIASTFEDSHYFLIVDLKKPREFEILENDSLRTIDNSGILTAHMLINTGVQAIYSGYCNPRAARVLKLAEIKVYDNVRGKVSECLKDNLAVKI